MTIAHVSGQNGGAAGNGTTTVSKAFTANVSTGSLITAVGMKYEGSNTPWVVGNLTQIAGTATLTGIQLDVSLINQEGATANYAAVGVWSAIVSAGGSCTLQLGGGTGGTTFQLIAIDEFTGSWDATRKETSNTNSADPGTTTTNADSGSVTSAGAALMVAGVQLNTSSAPTITDDAAFTSIYKNEAGTDDNGSAIYRIVSTGTTETANWTVTGTTVAAWAGAIVVYKEASAASAELPPLVMPPMRPAVGSRR